MTDQLLATFFVHSPEFPFGDIPVTARVTEHSGNNWWEDHRLRCTVTNAHYNDPDNANQLRRRYRIDVFRVAHSHWDWQNDQMVSYYPLGVAGVYRRRLEIRINNLPTSQPPTLVRMLYITVQPNLHVFVEGDRSQESEVRRIDLVYTEETVVSQNPLVKQLVVKINNTAEATAARHIALTQSNDYRDTVFVKSNLPLDLVSDDLTDNHTGDTWSSRWVQLKDKITVTRKIKNNEYQWGGYY